MANLYYNEKSGEKNLAILKMTMNFTLRLYLYYL